MSSKGNELHVELPKEQSKSLKTGQVPATSHRGRVGGNPTSLHLDLPMHILSDNCEKAMTFSKKRDRNSAAHTAL